MFSATAKATVPLSVPEAPLVIVNHAALLTEVQLHPVAILTATLPLPAADENDWLVGVIEGLQVNEKANVFDTSLADEPPGPTADTRASYTTPGTGAGFRSDTNATRIFPSASGAGFPRLTA